MAPELPDDFFTAEFSDGSTDPSDSATKDVRTATFKIYTGDANPSTALYGGRQIYKETDDSEDFRVLRSSIYDFIPYNLFDGHINRNIRAAISMIDLTAPYIWLTRGTYIEVTNQVEVAFKVNGCIDITEVSVIVNGETAQLASATDEVDIYCNHLVPDDKE